MDLIHKIESLRYDIENGVETDVIKISVRLIQIRDHALQLQQTGVIKSVCGNCERKQLYIKKQCYCGYCGDRLKTYQTVL